MIIIFVVTVVFLVSLFIHYKGNNRKLDNKYTIDYKSYWMKND